MDDKTEPSSPSARGIRVKAIRRAINLSRKTLGQRYDIPPGTIQNWEDGRFGGLTEKGAKKLLYAFEQEGVPGTLEWLMFGTGENPLERKQPLINSVNGKIEYFDCEGDIIARELAYFHQLNRNAVDIIMPDDSMKPHFYAGDHLAGKRYFGKDIQQLIGHICIIQTLSGQIMVRELQQGSTTDSYNLSCCQPVPDNSIHHQTDIKLFSAAPIVWIRRKNPLENNE